MGTKRRLDLAELAYGEERTQLEDVINKLVRGRLLVSGLRSSTHINGIEIVHEALIREWPQLRQWLEDVRDERRIHDRLAADAQSWEDSNREDNSLLYEGNTRERTVHWARRNAHSIDAPMSDFLLASFVHELIRNSNPTEVSKLLDSWSDHVEQDLLRLVLQQEAVNLRRKIRERHNAGIALALIGEQRPGIGVIGGLPDIEWCSVPEGQFIMGEGAEEHIVWIDSFAIAKYPITVAQFHAYVSAVKPYAAIRDAANLSRRPANHPVEVTWYDALGFCMWLSKELSRRHGTDIQVYLPTEAQWEKAARGGLQIPICPSKPDAGLFANPLPNRPYAWVDTLVDFDETQIPYYCNVYETDLRDTSSVGIFPNGASCYGCLDMAGNVLEWTSSKYQPYPYTADDGREVLDDSGDQRTLRGGSYAYFSSYSLCTARGRGNVADPDGDGFRIVCSSPNFWVL